MSTELPNFRYAMVVPECLGVPVLLTHNASWQSPRVSVCRIYA